MVEAPSTRAGPGCACARDLQSNLALSDAKILARCMVTDPHLLPDCGRNLPTLTHDQTRYKSISHPLASFLLFKTCCPQISSTRRVPFFPLPTCAIRLCISVSTPCVYFHICVLGSQRYARIIALLLSPASPNADCRSFSFLRELIVERHHDDAAVAHRTSHPSTSLWCARASRSRASPKRTTSAQRAYVHATATAKQNSHTISYRVKRASVAAARSTVRGNG